VKFKHKISRLALKDIDSIWKFTSQNWSNTQANIYFKGFFKQIDLICKNPEIGKPIDEVKIGHRLVLFKSHLIIYKIEKEMVLIDRILHQRMDIDNNL